MDAGESSPIAAFRRSISRRWLVVVLVAAVAVGAAAIATSARSSQYTSTGELLIVPLAQYDQVYFGSGMFRDSGDATLTAPTAAEVLHSYDIARAAAARLADGTSADEVLAGVRVIAVANTDVLQVVASARSGAGAIRLASAFVDAVISTRAREVSGDLERRIAVLRTRPAGARSNLDALRVALRAGSDPTVEVAQQPVRAKSASSLSAAAIIALALGGGVFLGLLGAFALDLLSSAVLDEADATRMLGLAPWGRVPRLERSLRQRGDAVAPSQLSRRAGSEYEEVAAQIARREPAGGVYAVVSPAEADGRTTTAAALCAALAKRGLRCALVSVATPPGAQLSAELANRGVALVSGAADGAHPLGKAVQDAQEVADVVVIDGVSLRRAGDLAALASLARLLVVVRLGHTPKDLLVQARTVFAELGAPPVGAVVLGAFAPRQTPSGARKRAAVADSGRR
jgi:capsular polysaccharide biosynthesis protein